MCNTYVIRPKRGAQGLAQRVSVATAKLASALVRKSDPGVVMRADSREWSLELPAFQRTAGGHTVREPAGETEETRFPAGVVLMG